VAPRTQAAEYKRLIGGCEMLVAERMTQPLAGLSTLVPRPWWPTRLKGPQALAAMAYAGLRRSHEKRMVISGRIPFCYPSDFEATLSQASCARAGSRAVLALQRNLRAAAAWPQANFTHPAGAAARGPTFC